MATDLLTTIRREIAARLSELGPSLREYQELISAEHALTGGAAAAARGGAGRGRATRGAAAKPARARRAGATRAGATPAAATRSTAKPAGATPAKTTRGGAARGGAAKATATSAASSAQARSAAAAVAAPVAAAPADAEGGPRRRYSRPGIRRRAADADAGAASRGGAGATTRSGARATTRSRSGAASPTGTGTAAKPRADVTEQAILAALEHGSHTTAELVTVTALSAQSIRRSLTRLERVGTIGRTRRDGRTAYLLSAGSA